MLSFKRKCFSLKRIGILCLLFVTVFLNARKVLSETQKNMYMIKINRYHNTITVYEKDLNGNYTKPIKAMVCSVGQEGTKTILGTYQTKEKYRWKLLMGNVWGQYSTRIVNGILFHSVYYYRFGDPASLATAEYNKLGKAASHGCVRLKVEDAKWIYDNCSIGTTVVIYDDKNSPGPLGKPKSIQLPLTVRWDPTDPDKNNPYYLRKPTISGAKNKTIPFGSEVDLRKGITAKSTVGLDITPKIKIKGEVNTNQAGKYKITYTIKDDLERTNKVQVVITIKQQPTQPAQPAQAEQLEQQGELVITGVQDRIINKYQGITRAFALEGVHAFSGDIEIDHKLIKIKTEMKNEEQCLVTYSINMGKGRETKETAIFYLDGEAPKLEGVSNRKLLPDEVIDKELALTGITVSDNYSKLGVEDIIVTIDKLSDIYYQITYEVSDEVGNVTKRIALFEY